MSYRGGRGRGRFGGGGGFKYVKQDPFELFPDITLPPVRSVSKEEMMSVIWNSRLQNYWKSSPYYLEDTVSKVSENIDVERYSDREKPKRRATRHSFMQFLEANASNFPKELVADSREDPRKKPRKVQWKPESGLQKLDFFEKLEQKYQAQGDKGENEKKEGEGEDEDEEEAEEADEEFSDDGDYNQNVDFDDDEDDFNMDDGGDDEGTY